MLGIGLNGVCYVPHGAWTVGGSEFTVTLNGLTSGEAQNQTTLTYNTVNGTPQEQRWQTSEFGTFWTDVLAGDTPSETIDFEAGIHTDGHLIRVAVTSDNTEAFSLPVRMVQQPPVQVSPIAEQAFLEDTGLQTLDISGAFIGTALNYSVDPFTGVAIDSLTGIISFNTGLMELQDSGVLSVAVENSGGQATANLSITVSAANFISIENIDNEPVITFDDGAFSISLANGVYAGSYSTGFDGTLITVATLLTAPIAIVPPAVIGGTGPGDTLKVVPGLWLYANLSPGNPSYQWTQDGVEIPSETSLQYNITTLDAGSQMSVIETFGNGIAASTSILLDPPPPFAPAVIPSLVDDFDASANPSMLTKEAQSVTAWGNASNGVNGFYSSTANQHPSTGAVIKNGLETVSFDGSQYLAASNPVAFSPSGTVMIAFKANDADSPFDSIFAVQGGSFNFQIDTDTVSSGAFFGRVNSNAHTNLERAASSNNDWMILAYRWDAASGVASLWTNGLKDDEVIDYVNPYPSSPSAILLAANRALDHRLACDIGQVWRFDAALSDFDLGQMFTYASSRWGIALDT